MVDKILEFSQGEKTLSEIRQFEKEIISTKNARYIFLFAKYIKKANIKLLSEEILKINDKRYIHFFIRSIRNIDYEIFINKILEYNDARYLFYIVYDTKLLPQKNIVDIGKKIYELNDVEYLNMFLYYFFVVANLKNDEIFKILSDSLKKYDIKNVTNENYKEVLLSLQKSIPKKVLNESTKGTNYSSNCYIGRKEWIPDIIVCHISSNYEKMINTFYDSCSEVSSHFVVAMDGRYKQIIDLDNSSWANGTSLSQDSDVYYKFATSEIIKNREENANYYTFSIEHESYDGNLTEEQYKTTLLLMKKIINYIKKKYNYDFEIDRKHIIGHKEVNPIVRTICPGELFPFEKIINDLKH